MQLRTPTITALGITLGLLSASCSAIFGTDEFREGGGTASCESASDCGDDEGCREGTCVPCDGDGDGYFADEAWCGELLGGGPPDCRDEDPFTYPGAPPHCGDGELNDCEAEDVMDPLFGEVGVLPPQILLEQPDFVRQLSVGAIQNVQDSDLAAITFVEDNMPFEGRLVLYDVGGGAIERQDVNLTEDRGTAATPTLRLRRAGPDNLAFGRAEYDARFFIGKIALSGSYLE